MDKLINAPSLLTCKLHGAHGLQILVGLLLLSLVELGLLLLSLATSLATRCRFECKKRGKHQCHKEEREQTACLQAFSSESAPAILFATNLSSRNQMIIFNLVDMIINAWLMFNACQVCLLRAVENLGKNLLIAPSTQVDTMQNMRIWIQALLDLGVTKHLNLSNLVF